LGEEGGEEGPADVGGVAVEMGAGVLVSSNIEVCVL
jgi:hypothetical protein